MKLTLLEQLNQFMRVCQGALFPALQEELGPLTEKQRQLLERLSSDVALRRIRRWESQREIPHESAFSRAFAEFAESELPRRLHAALIEETRQRQADRAYLAGFHAN